MKELPNSYILKIRRGSPGHQFWEEFELPLRKGENLISGLMEIAMNPINRKGESTTPVVYEAGCLEEVCGSCSMLVNGYPRQACTALVENYIHETKSNEITLAPFTKFPLVRDLMVDRSSMFESLKKVSGWVDASGGEGTGFGPKISPERQALMYSLSKCMTCGCCSEGCPQVNAHSPFMGPAPIAQAWLFNSHPTGALEKSSRLHALMEDHGISECGNAQNCVEVCPKGVPLTDAIGAIGRDVTLQGFRDLFSLPGRES